MLLNFRALEVIYLSEICPSIQSRYARVVECMFSNLSVFDLKGHLIYVNEQAAKLFGYESAQKVIDEEKGSVFLRWTPINQVNEAISKYENLLKTGKLDPFKTIVLRKDGTKFLIEATAALVYDSNKKPTEIIFLAREVSNQDYLRNTLKENSDSTFLLPQRKIDKTKFSLDTCFKINEEYINLIAFKWDAFSLSSFAESGNQFLSDEEKLEYGLFLTTLVSNGSKYHEGLYGPFPFHENKEYETLSFSKMIPAKNVQDSRMSNQNFMVIALVYPRAHMREFALLRGLIELIFELNLQLISSIEEISNSTLSRIKKDISSFVNNTKKAIN